MKKRLITALAAYAVLGVIASFLLHGAPLYVVLILFAMFALRAVIAVKGGFVLSQNEAPIPDERTEVEQDSR